MQDKLNEKKLNKIKDKLEASDEVIYLVGTDLFREKAGRDMKLLVQEIETCWKEINNLREDLRILSEKVSNLA